MEPKTEMPYEDTLKEFDKNYNYFQSNWQTLLEQHKDLEGKAVAIKDKQIIANGDSEDTLRSRIYEKFGNVGVYITILREPKDEVKIVRPRVRVVEDGE